MSGDYSYLELRYYIGLVFSIILAFMGIVMIGLGGLGVFFGSILLLMLVGFWIMAYYYHKRKRCPSCERLILDSAYLVCPFCGKRLKDEFGQPIE